MTDFQPQETYLVAPLFKAVGVVKGEVNLGEDGINTINVDGKSYRLKYASDRVKAIWALKMHVKKTGNNEQRLIVYPRVTHFPNRGQPYIIHFELIGFEGPLVEDKGILNHLSDLEFKLSGLWQFIPVCRLPCVTILKNSTEERKLFIQEAEPLVKMRFTKAAHLPLLWRNSAVNPFRFNRDLTKEEQGRPKFVQLKVKFIPQQDTFEFLEQLAEPLDEAPNFLKAPKADKGDKRKLAAPNKIQKPIKKEPVPKPKLARPSKAKQP